jgi:hypothetical protein
MKKQNTVFTFNFCLFTLFSLRLGGFMATSQLCKTNPISYSNKMNTTFLLTRNYEQMTMNREPLKTNPIKPNL